MSSDDVHGRFERALGRLVDKLKQDNYAEFLFSKDFQPLGSS